MYGQGRYRQVWPCGRSGGGQCSQVTPPPKTPSRSRASHRSAVLPLEPELRPPGPALYDRVRPLGRASACALRPAGRRPAAARASRPVCLWLGAQSVDERRTPLGPRRGHRGVCDRVRAVNWLSDARRPPAPAAMPWKPMYHSDVKLSGKTVVITGANTGIGKETVRDLYGRGARVIMGVRTVSKGRAAVSEIESAGGETGGKMEVFELDLESLASVRSFAEAVNGATEKIELLILNAGKMACPRSETQDGFESQLGTNHLGHFLLTELLLDKVKAASPSRVIVLSSLAHETGKMNFDDLQLKSGYSPWKAYGQSKLANVLFASELGRRLEGTGVTTYAVHPGWVRTELDRHMPTWQKVLVSPVRSVASKSPVQGAQTTLYCALEPSLADKTGRYYADCAEKTPSSRARKKEDAERLWKVSEELVGLSRG